MSAFKSQYNNAQIALHHNNTSLSCLEDNCDCDDNFQFMNCRRLSVSNSKEAVSKIFKQSLKNDKILEGSRRETTSSYKKSNEYLNNVKTKCKRKFSLFSTPISSTSSIFSSITDFGDAQTRRISGSLQRVGQSAVARHLSNFVSNVGDVVNQELLLGLICIITISRLF